MDGVPDGLLPARLGPGARGWFTTRAGGSSRGTWAAPGGAGGRNLGAHVGDVPADVETNRRRTEDDIGAAIAWMAQRHTATVRLIGSDEQGARYGQRAFDAHGPAEEQATDGCDATIVHGRVDLAAGVLVADCVPLLLAGTAGDAVAAVHVGRAGLVAGIVPAVLERLRSLGVAGAAVHASLGPSICGRCYEVPADLQAAVVADAPAARATSAWGTPALDIPAGVQAQLTAGGVEHVEVHGACTRTDERFFSYRRSPRTGRCSGLVVAAGRDTPETWRPTASDLV